MQLTLRADAGLAGIGVACVTNHFTRRPNAASRLSRDTRGAGYWVPATRGFVAGRRIHRKHPAPGSRYRRYAALISRSSISAMRFAASSYAAAPGWKSSERLRRCGVTMSAIFTTRMRSSCSKRVARIWSQSTRY